MYKYPIYEYTITTSELPGEVALTIVFNNCRNHCPDCHSPHLWLNQFWYSLVDVVERVKREVKNYPEITAILLMGGDTNGLSKEEYYDLVAALRDILPVGIYSGSDSDTLLDDMKHFDNVLWLKTGSYRELFGGLECVRTNQHFYKKDFNILFDNSCVYMGRIPFWNDITAEFQKANESVKEVE